MKETFTWKTIKRFAVGVGCSLFISFLFAAMARYSTFSRRAAEAAETFSTVVWYLQGGYWREDITYYLTHEPVF
jgi:hypothetical protein